jgi:hypothetical protein
LSIAEQEIYSLRNRNSKNLATFEAKNFRLETRVWYLDSVVSKTERERNQRDENIAKIKTDLAALAHDKYLSASSVALDLEDKIRQHEVHANNMAEQEAALVRERNAAQADAETFKKKIDELSDTSTNPVITELEYAKSLLQKEVDHLKRQHKSLEQELLAVKQTVRSNDQGSTESMKKQVSLKEEHIRELRAELEAVQASNARLTSCRSRNNSRELQLSKNLMIVARGEGTTHAADFQQPQPVTAPTTSRAATTEPVYVGGALEKLSGAINISMAPGPSQLDMPATFTSGFVERRGDTLQVRVGESSNGEATMRPLVTSQSSSMRTTTRSHRDRGRSSRWKQPSLQQPRDCRDGDRGRSSRGKVASGGSGGSGDVDLEGGSKTFGRDGVATRRASEQWWDKAPWFVQGEGGEQLNCSRFRPNKHHKPLRDQNIYVLELPAETVLQPVKP